jgi:K+-transporting ATPase ATPase C chain
MKKYFFPSTVLMTLFTFLLGIIYPIFMTKIGTTFWAQKSEGSLIKKNDFVVGSELIGQDWKKEIYFYGRPSVSQYDPYASGASNLSPLNLKTKIDESGLPEELVLASGSGLDPDLSLKAIYFQIPRVSKARKISVEEIKKLVLSLVEKKLWGVLGEERVNVLKLNIELDSLTK